MAPWENLYTRSLFNFSSKGPGYIEAAECVQVVSRDDQYRPRSRYWLLHKISCATHYEQFLQYIIHDLLLPPSQFTNWSSIMLYLGERPNAVRFGFA